jgi:hypothetical protein
VSDELIPVLHVIQRLKPRRVSTGIISNGIICQFEKTVATRLRILTWIEKNTNGRFFLGISFIEFEDQTDAIMFKLGYSYD